MKPLSSKYRFPTVTGKFQTGLHVSGSCLLGPPVPSRSSLKALAINCQRSDFVLKADCGLRKLSWMFAWKQMYWWPPVPAFSSFYSQMQLQCLQVHTSTVNHQPITITCWAVYGKLWESEHTPAYLQLWVSTSNPYTPCGFCWASLLISNYSGFSTAVRTDVKQSILLHFSFWHLNKINQPKGCIFSLEGKN